MSTPAQNHPFRQEARRSAIAYRRGWAAAQNKRGRKHHGEWRCTHLLTYEDQTIGRLYFWRGAYYTAEQYASGEPGYSRKDLREGESIERVYGSRDDDE